jgi:hypothetical protein
MEAVVLLPLLGPVATSLAQPALLKAQPLLVLPVTKQLEYQDQ